MYNLLKTWIYASTNFIKLIAQFVLGASAVLIAVAVFCKAFSIPLIGDVELIQLCMVTLIMFGLAYTQKEDDHVSIGLIVDKMPMKIQNLLDILANILVAITSFVVGYVFFNVGIEHMTEMKITTDLLGIPYYPFDFIIMIGFIMWGLVSLIKLIDSVATLSNTK